MEESSALNVFSIRHLGKSSVFTSSGTTPVEKFISRDSKVNGSHCETSAKFDVYHKQSSSTVTRSLRKRWDQFTGSTLDSSKIIHGLRSRSTTNLASVTCDDIYNTYSDLYFNEGTAKSEIIQMEKGETMQSTDLDRKFSFLRTPKRLHQSDVFLNTSTTHETELSIKRDKSRHESSRRHFREIKENVKRNASWSVRTGKARHRRHSWRKHSNVDEDGMDVGKENLADMSNIENFNKRLLDAEIKERQSSRKN